MPTQRKGVSNMLLREFFYQQYKPKKLHGKSVNTVRLYDVLFRNFARTLKRAPTLDDLTNDAIQAHMQRLLDDGRTKATANRDRCSMVALWRYAAKQGIIDRWPDVPKEVEPIREPQAWLREDIEKLFNAVAKLEGCLRDTRVPWSLWFELLIRVMLDTGERIGAVREARWNWLDNGSLLVPAEFRKGGKRDKFFPLSKETIDLLFKMRKVSSDKTQIFPWTYSATYLWNRYNRLIETAGLPNGRHSKTHRLRKTHASVANAAGLDAQKLLDHSSSRITARYIDARFSTDVKASDVLAAWLRTPPPTQARKKA